MSPRLGRAGAELTDLGIPAKEALRLVERVRRNAESAARTFVHLFVEEVWKPFQRDGSPEERWPEILDALERLRPLASDSLMAVFLMAMEEEVEEALGRELKRARRDAKRQRACRAASYPAPSLTLRPAGFFFAPGRLPTEESRSHGSRRRTNRRHPGVPGVQAAQLSDAEVQAQQSGPDRAAQVLPLVRQAHPPQGNPLAGS